LYAVRLFEKDHDIVMVFFRDTGVGRQDLTPQNSTLFLRVKSDARLGLTKKSSFLGGHYPTKQRRKCLCGEKGTATMKVKYNQ